MKQNINAENMNDAIANGDEIATLRAMLTRQSESAHEAVRLMSEYAQRYGFLLGGLEMVAAGHTTAEAVLARAREKYDQSDDMRRHEVASDAT